MLRQTVESIQIEHKPIEAAEAGQSVGLGIEYVRETLFTELLNPKT